MNPSSIPPFVSSILFILFGWFVYWQKRNAILNFTFFLLCLTTFLWQFSWAFLYSRPQHDVASFLVKVGYSGIILVPVTYFRFVVEAVNSRRERWILLYGYATTVLMLGFLWGTNLFVSGYKELPWGFYPQAATLHPLYLMEIVVVSGRGFQLLFKELRAAQIFQRKNQMKYLIGGLIIYIPCVSDFLPNYNATFYPLGSFFITAFLLVTGLGIVKHQLLDIEVIIRRTVVFAALFAVVFGVFVGVTLLTQELLAGGKLLGLAISSAIIILTVRPLEIFLVRATDRFLFQKKYDYKHILRSHIDEVITLLSLDKIVQGTLELLGKTLHPENAAILLLNRYQDRYVSYGVMGYERDVALDSDSKVLKLLKASKEIFSVEDSRGALKVTDELREEMKGLRTRLAIPLLLHNDLIGIKLLGPKKSGESYTVEDLEVLTDLARTEAIAIGNAQLFTEAAQNERRAAIGTLAAGINHEVCNPLNIINTKIQVYLMSLEKGLYKDKSLEQVIEDSKEIMNLCFKQTARISDITKKLSNFAKPSADSKPEPTDIEEQIDDTLAVVGHELELDRVKIQKEIQPALPRILSDKRQIQQIFFNLIKNAGQAIQEKGLVTIKAYQENGEVKVEVSDTGHGIPEDKLEKIYDPFYSTKEPGKGTGLGLSIVRQLVWRNKGNIQVKSKMGSGTVFTVSFPKA